MSNPDVSEELKTELVKIGLQALKTLNATPTQIPGWHYTEETQMRSIIEAIAPRLKAEGLREGEAKGIRDTIRDLENESQLWTHKAKAAKRTLFARADALSPQAKETK